MALMQVPPHWSCLIFPLLVFNTNTPLVGSLLPNRLQNLSSSLATKHQSVLVLHPARRSTPYLRENLFNCRTFLCRMGLLTKIPKLEKFLYIIQTTLSGFSLSILSYTPGPSTAAYSQWTNAHASRFVHAKATEERLVFFHLAGPPYQEDRCWV
jgi:hypothetical protein